MNFKQFLLVDVNQKLEFTGGATYLKREQFKNKRINEGKLVKIAECVIQNNLTKFFLWIKQYFRLEKLKIENRSHFTNSIYVSLVHKLIFD